ncbi:hypothetical protein D7322_24935 [Sphingobacterium puteale]|uniref:Uncharacterized protein n=1 Tax=Sphingobacterium puteale TaxID=2420510 RepID=A0A420VR79_9SPHI|nr:hypothetical protein D7322_24935 [Sphingobacterium puteale]
MPLDFILKFFTKVIDFRLNSGDISRHLINILYKHQHSISRSTESHKLNQVFVETARAKPLTYSDY